MLEDDHHHRTLCVAQAAAGVGVEGMGGGGEHAIWAGPAEKRQHRGGAAVQEHASQPSDDARVECVGGGERAVS